MISVIGAGRVGSSTAMRLAEMNLDDVMLIDIVEGLALGQSLDIAHTCGFDIEIGGSHRFEDIRGSELVVNTAGFARTPGMTRLDLLNKNTEITRSVADEIKRYAPDAIVIQVANPMDLMSLVMMKATGFPRDRVLGMGGMLDTLRFACFIGREVGVSPRKVSAMVIGEHGDTMVPLRSQSTVDGKPLTDMLDTEVIDKLVERTRQGGTEIVRLMGSAFYAPSRAVALMAESVLKDSGGIIPTSVYLDGEYGVCGIFVGVPAKLGTGGLASVVELDLDQKERPAFERSCNVLKDKVSEMRLD